MTDVSLIEMRNELQDRIVNLKRKKALTLASSFDSFKTWAFKVLKKLGYIIVRANIYEAVLKLLKILWKFLIDVFTF